MPDEPDAIRDRAEALLRGREFGSPIVLEAGTVEAPIAIRAPGGALHSWFVGVSVGDRLAGYLRFVPDGSLLGYSSFQRHDDSLAGCPAASTWTDPEVIRRVAQDNARDDERAGQPWLTFDHAPSRLAWAVPLTEAGGTTRILHVAGGTVWEATTRDADIESYGGSAG